MHWSPRLLEATEEAVRGLRMKSRQPSAGGDLRDQILKIGKTGRREARHTGAGKDYEATAAACSEKPRGKLNRSEPHTPEA
jgi:hypothetical protein